MTYQPKAAVSTPAKRAKAVTQADIIVVMFARDINAAQDRVQSAADPQERAKAIAERNALIGLRDKVKRYLSGDLSVLV